MYVCPDCRNALQASEAPCSCGWTPRFDDGITDFLSSRDRTTAESSEYRDTYEMLAERNLVEPSISDRYVSHLAARFSKAIGDVAGKDVCDVGAGRGYLIERFLAQSPKSTTAIDIAAPALKAITEARGVPGILANAENLPFERHFDVISATDIVEHVLNVSNFLVSANWALRDRGILAVRVPYLENMINYSNFHGLPMHFTHLRTFDSRTLVALVTPFGFKVESIHYDGFFPTRLHPFLDRVPPLSRALQGALLRWYSCADEVTTIPPSLGRLLMRPVEVGLVARKVEHLKAVNLHEPLQRYHQQRVERLRSGSATP